MRAFALALALCAALAAPAYADTTCPAGQLTLLEKMIEYKADGGDKLITKVKSFGKADAIKIVASATEAPAPANLDGLVMFVFKDKSVSARLIDKNTCNFATFTTNIECVRKLLKDALGTPV